MKKTINTVLILLLTLILSSCFGGNNEEVNNAKKELGIIVSDGTETDSDTGTNIGMDLDQIDTDEDEVKKIEIKSLTDDQFLELDDLSQEDVLDGEVNIKGKTLSKVDKIIVNFSNETSKFPVDNYTLKQFTPGMDNFLYRAFTEYETLDLGKNVYLIEAYSGDKVSKLELIINVQKEEDSTTQTNEKTQEYDGEDFLDSLPTKETFGSPIDLGNGQVSYTDLKGLEIKKYTNSNLTCESLTIELASVIKSWFFWNTCRPIDGDKGISYYIIRLDGDNYVYEKHYYLSLQGIYGIQELETGEGVNIDNIGEKNTELKEKNSEFTIIKVTDELFKEILN